jgi:hypothetical protein
MGVPHKVVIAKGRLVKQRTHGKYTMYSVVIHKRKGIPSGLEELLGKELTVILADEGGEE